MKRYRKTGRGGGLFSALEHEAAVAGKTTGIVDASFIEAPRQRNEREQN